MGCEEWGVGEFGIGKGEKMLEQDIRFLAEELEKGKLVVFVGAGVSKNQAKHCQKIFGKFNATTAAT